MNYRLITMFIALCLSAWCATFADLKLPVKTIGNESFYYYKVGGNETVDKVARKLGITAADVIKYNPSAADGLVKKQLLFFPVSSFSSSATTPQVAVRTEHVTHVVKSGESIFGIAKLYNLNPDDLILANPKASEGIEPGDVLNIPVEGTLTASAPAGRGIVFHTIVRNETLYSVAKRYNTTIENLLELNPGIYPDHFVAGDVIKVAPNTTHDITVQKDIKQFVPYTVREGDTYQSVATAHGVSAEALRQANPDQKKLKAGKTIYIPRDATDTRVVNSSQASAKELEQTYSGQMDKVYRKVNNATASDHEINMAIVLPFQLQKAEPPRQAYLYTDFYKGFLLAVDSIGAKTHKKVNLNVYDTQHNLNVTDSLLALPEMKKMDVIVAPGEPKQLERCNRFGKDNNIMVVNCFSPKNDDYANNPQVIQLNAPTSYMMSAVNSWIDQNCKDYEIVWLDDPTSNNDKEIYTTIHNHVKATRMKDKTLTIISPLSYEMLTQYLDPGSNYLFIATNDSRELLDKVAGAIKEAKEKRFDCEIKLLGYPNYITYLNHYKETFKAIDTYIFSRFFIASQPRARAIYEKFKHAYGNDMIVTNPSMGLMGFDLGMYLISTFDRDSAITDHTPKYDGIQMDVDLRRASNWGGLINRCVELIHCTHAGMSESIIE